MLRSRAKHLTPPTASTRHPCLAWPGTTALRENSPFLSPVASGVHGGIKCPMVGSSVSHTGTRTDVLDLTSALGRALVIAAPFHLCAALSLFVFKLDGSFLPQTFPERAFRLMNRKRKRRKGHSLTLHAFFFFFERPTFQERFCLRTAEHSKPLKANLYAMRHQQRSRANLQPVKHRCCVSFQCWGKLGPEPEWNFLPCPNFSNPFPSQKKQKLQLRFATKISMGFFFHSKITFYYDFWEY